MGCLDVLCVNAHLAIRRSRQGANCFERNVTFRVQLAFDFDLSSLDADLEVFQRRVFPGEDVPVQCLTQGVGADGNLGGTDRDQERFRVIKHWNRSLGSRDYGSFQLKNVNRNTFAEVVEDAIHLYVHVGSGRLQGRGSPDRESTQRKQSK